MKPKVSFVIPVYNGIPFMARTIDTLRNQTVKEIEIIVVDDGSSDGLYELMKYYTNIDNRIKYFWFTDNKGAARCRNYGNKKAQADIICVTDCGDAYPKDKARLVYNYFKKHPDIGVFSTGVVCTDCFGNEIDTQISKPFTGKLGEKPNISHPTASYRKWIALKWPYRETSKATDQYVAFFITLARNGIKFGVTNKIYLSKLQMDGFVYAQLDGDSRIGFDRYKHYRDITEARRVKKKNYEEFGVPVPGWLENY